MKYKCFVIVMAMAASFFTGMLFGGCHDAKEGNAAIDSLSVANDSLNIVNDSLGVVIDSLGKEAEKADTVVVQAVKRYMEGLKEIEGQSVADDVKFFKEYLDA